MIFILAMWCQRHATNDIKLGVGMKEMNVIDVQGALQKTII